jgi:Arc/MetJ family transcription regulator
MRRMTVDVDERLCAEVMDEFGFATESEAINYALRQALRRAGSPASEDDSEWDGDLGEVQGMGMFDDLDS